MDGTTLGPLLIIHCSLCAWRGSTLVLGGQTALEHQCFYQVATCGNNDIHNRVVTRAAVCSLLERTSSSVGG